MTEDYCVVLFCSRNKDNIDVLNFTQRTKHFVAKNSDYNYIKEAFNAFLKEGVPGELSRFYMSVNRRDPKLIRDNLMMRMLNQHDNFDPTKMNAMLVSVAASADCALDHNWLFDLDYYEDNLSKPTEEEVRHMFSKYVDPESINIISTVHGLSVISSIHFDTRELLKTYPWISLKKDDMMLVDWGVNQ